jgi:glycosyltransferase involved in cell wall biosynthesis
MAQREEVDLFVVATSAGTNSNFSDVLMEGVDCRLLHKEEFLHTHVVRDIVMAHRPDVLVVSGWNNPAYVRLGFDPIFENSRRVMAMDNPFRGDWRQHLGRWKLVRYLRRMDTVWVPGERAWQLARFFGVPEHRVRRGLYGINCRALAPLHTERAALPDGWPKGFLFVGQMAIRKGVDLLLEGYADYRRRVVDPWPLCCCGIGPLAPLAASLPGVQHLGFVQPAEMLKVFRNCGALAIFSREDAWPVVVVEACAAGLPVLCSDACGSSVEVVRHLHNGLLVPTGNARGIADALSWIHMHYPDLPAMGLRSAHLAAAYSADTWAERLLAIVGEPRASHLQAN